MCSGSLLAYRFIAPPGFLTICEQFFYPFLRCLFWIPRPRARLLDRHGPLRLGAVFVYLEEGTPLSFQVSPSVGGTAPQPFNLLEATSGHLMKYVSVNPMTFKLANSWQAKISLPEEECRQCLNRDLSGRKPWWGHIMEIKPTFTCGREVTQ